MARKRPYGTGALWIENGMWIGRWHAPGGGRPKRRVGPARQPGSNEGLTRTQAEAELRKLVDGDGAKVATDPCRTIDHVGRLHLGKLIANGRKKSHTDGLESHLRVHLVPFFGTTPINRIDETDVERLAAQLRTRKGLAPKTIRNVLGTPHSICDFAERKHWIASNPYRLAEGPPRPTLTPTFAT
jgi:integrase